MSSHRVSAVEVWLQYIIVVLTCLLKLVPLLQFLKLFEP